MKNERKGKNKYFEGVWGRVECLYLTKITPQKATFPNYRPVISSHS
jgi:hypothetical protein